MKRHFCSPRRLAVILTAFSFLYANGGLAKDKVGVFRPTCDHTVHIRLINQRGEKLVMDVWLPGFLTTWHQTRDAIFEGSARCCSKDGSCIGGRAKVRFSHLTERRAVGTYSIVRSNGTSEQGPFRAKRAKNSALTCE